MNVYEAMNEMRADANLYSIGDALAVLHAAADAYNELAPTPEMWAQYPWAQWYAIDASGSAGMFGQEPEIEDHIWVIEWTEESDLPVEASTVSMPLGIDWRLCKWSRPEGI